MTRRQRLLWAFLPGLVAVPILALMDPIPQDLCYHAFADQRTVWGIPYFGDVVTNLPLVIAGVLGLCMRPSLEWGVFFTGIGLAGIGSGYYHLDPTNETLVWDRAPMAIAFMGFFAALIGERVDKRWGRRLLWPLVVVGVASVVYWAATDDLRLYGLVQFYPMVAAILLLLLLPGEAGYYWLAIGSYVMAKVVELLDRPIWDVNGVASGHNLKHIFAALGAWWIACMLRDRRRARAAP